MAHSAPNFQCCFMYQHQLQKPNLQRSSVIDKPRYHCAPHSQSLSINNLQHQYKLTTPLNYTSPTPLPNIKIQSNVHAVLLGQVSKYQGHFFIYWVPGKSKKSNYFTKRHIPSHHTAMRHEYHQNANDSIIFVPL